MIAKHIKPKPQTEEEKKTRPYSYKGLAIYIASAPEEGEKLDDFWIVNSAAGETIDDLDLAIIDIENTQKMNTRVKEAKDKTYHLMVSFRDEKPNLEALKDMEREFAKALGFEEHQRVVGTHINTDNFHMHVAYNKIHPKTLKSQRPFDDFIALSRVCRKMEHKYGLKFDNGFEKTKEPDYEKPNRKAKDFEAITWQQSFYSYVKERKEPLTKALNQAQKWQDLHNAFEEQGLLIKRRGNGMIISSLDEKIAIKASDLDRQFSRFALEKKLGKFIDSQKTQKNKCEYEEKPLTRHPNTKELWEKYKKEKYRRPKPQKKSSLLKKAFYHWRDFLMAEALKDPLAMAIIILQKQDLNMLFNPLGSDKNQSIKKHVAGVKSQEPEIKDEEKVKKQAEETEKIFIAAAFTKKDELKALGAKWDRKVKSWYILKDDDITKTINKIDKLISMGDAVNISADIAKTMEAENLNAETQDQALKKENDKKKDNEISR